MPVIFSWNLKSSGQFLSITNVDRHWKLIAQHLDGIVIFFQFPAIFLQGCLYQGYHCVSIFRYGVHAVDVKIAESVVHPFVCWSVYINSLGAVKLYWETESIRSGFSCFLHHWWMLLKVFTYTVQVFGQIRRKMGSAAKPYVECLLSPNNMNIATCFSS